MLSLFKAIAKSLFAFRYCLQDRAKTIAITIREELQKEAMNQFKQKQYKNKGKVLDKDQYGYRSIEKNNNLILNKNHFSFWGHQYFFADWWRHSRYLPSYLSFYRSTCCKFCSLETF